MMKMILLKMKTVILITIWIMPKMNQRERKDWERVKAHPNFLRIKMIIVGSGVQVIGYPSPADTDDKSRRKSGDIVGDANPLRSVSSRNIENLMESFAGDSGDSGVNRVFKMLTSSRAGPDMNTEHEAIEVEVQILEQLTVGCPSLRSGVNGMFCPVDKDLPSTVVAYSLASLRTHAALDAYFNNAFGGAGNIK